MAGVATASKILPEPSTLPEAYSSNTSSDSPPKILNHVSPHTTFGLSRATNHDRPLPPNLSIDPITPATVPSFRRILSLLLPIRYPDKFFAESVANTTSTSLARVATWHHKPQSKLPKAEESELPKPQDCSETSENVENGTNETHDDRSPKETQQSGIVIAGIQCRTETLPIHPLFHSNNHIIASPSPFPHPQDSPSTSLKDTKKPQYCYIQTLAVLSPYRSKGIATALLDSIISTLCREEYYSGNIKTIYAHVWTENEEALEWYVRRGFRVSEGVVEGYYRRLKPGGARVVWRDLGVEDFLRAQRSGE
ncbi:MAG: hypothetical protein Q9220_000102 [cf. Caloplaca sp. 1 TL-2023]